MSQIRRIANEHIKHDLEAGTRWACDCEACHKMRSLVGVDKLLNVWPLVREIDNVEEKLREVSDGPAMSELLEQYLTLNDKLADAITK